MAVVSLILVIFVSLLVPGLIARVRARLAGRKGWEVFQHIANVELLMKKSVVYSYTSTVITQIVPVLYLGLSFLILLFVPVGEFGALLSFKGDLVMFAYLMGLSKFLLIIAAMDSGSSFQGMGSAREAFYGALLEPAIFVVGGTLALLSGNMSFSSMFTSIASLSGEVVMILILVGYLFTRILNVELGRIPFDDTRTHLELTMLHEVMILDYSGVDLAFIHLASWFKMGALSVLAGNAVAAAFSGGWLVSVLVALGVALVVGFTESFMAKNKMTRNTTYVLIITSIALVSFVTSYLVSQNIFI